MSLIKEIKSEWKKALIGLIVVFGVSKFEMIVDYFDTGINLKKQEQFKNQLLEALNDENIVKGISNNKNIKKLSKDIIQEYRNELVDEITKTDSNKVSIRSYLAKEVDIYEANVLPLLANMLKDYKKGKFNKQDTLN